MRRTGWMPVMALLCGLTACSGAADQDEPSNAGEGTKGPNAPAGTLTLSAQQLARIGVTFEAAQKAEELPIGTVPATLAPPPNARVAVAALIPGVVTRTMVVEGDAVKAGQPLALVAAREIFALASGIEQMSARVAAARANDRRLQQLASEGVIAGARAEEARATLRGAEAELSEQQRVVRLVNGAPKSGSYTLTAPIAGKVTSVAIQTGSPVDGATSAYVIDAVSRYELTAQLPERLIGQVKPGMTVRIGDDLRGEVTSVGSAIDPQTRSAVLRARIPAGPGIVSGRAMPAMLYAPAEAGMVSVPAAAVIEIDGAPSVFLRSAKGVQLRKIEVSGSADGRTAIKSGLRAGDQIVISGMSELKSIVGQD